MTELLEMVTAAVDLDTGWQCPFPHFPKKHDKQNELPPDQDNDAKKLSNALDKESKHLQNIPISFTQGGKTHNEEAQFTAHHLIPGNESWPPSKSQLHKWVDSKEGNIIADIGYNVNAAYNGVDLPGNSGASSWSNPPWQDAYACMAMFADKKGRQFHDRHPAYSDFVVNCLNKVAEKIESQLKPGTGCGDKNCSTARQKPYEPPYGLIARLVDISRRLEAKLAGDPTKWKEPVVTSRFVLVYKDKISQADARERLRTGNFDYGP
jgi:hypothetical protein